MLDKEKIFGRMFLTKLNWVNFGYPNMKQTAIVLNVAPEQFGLPHSSEYLLLLFNRTKKKNNICHKFTHLDFKNTNTTGAKHQSYNT